MMEVAKLQKYFQYAAELLIIGKWGIYGGLHSHWDIIGSNGHCN